MEIGPFCNPLVPREKSFTKINVDIENREALQLIAKRKGKSEMTIASMEEVDIVGDASRLAELVRSHGKVSALNWIASSHNFEHLPNPLGFLQDCGELLTDDGVLMMVIPDQRFTIDRFHPHTSTVQILRAAEQPRNVTTDAWALFEQRSLTYHLSSTDSAPKLAWNSLIHSDQLLSSKIPLTKHHYRLKKLLKSEDFRFTGHRWHFTPSVFELLLFDLIQLQLIRLQIVQIYETSEYDFLVILKRGLSESLTEVAAAAQRLELCCRIENERAAASGLCREQALQLAEQKLEIERLRGNKNDPRSRGGTN